MQWAWRDVSWIGADFPNQAIPEFKVQLVYDAGLFSLKSETNLIGLIERCPEWCKVFLGELHGHAETVEPIPVNTAAFDRCEKAVSADPTS